MSFDPRAVRVPRARLFLNIPELKRGRGSFRSIALAIFDGSWQDTWVYIYQRILLSNYFRENRFPSWLGKKVAGMRIKYFPPQLLKTLRGS